jgi:hypothetical protein
MADNDKRGPPGSSTGAQLKRETERRRARQAAALRENLRRRKAQERARDTVEPSAKTNETESPS